jgi:hypothetical protein
MGSPFTLPSRIHPSRAFTPSRPPPPLCPPLCPSRFLSPPPCRRRFKADHAATPPRPSPLLLSAPQHAATPPRPLRLSSALHAASPSRPLRLSSAPHAVAAAASPVDTTRTAGTGRRNRTHLPLPSSPSFAAPPHVFHLQTLTLASPPPSRAHPRSCIPVRRCRPPPLSGAAAASPPCRPPADGCTYGTGWPPMDLARHRSGWGRLLGGESACLSVAS